MDPGPVMVNLTALPSKDANLRGQTSKDLQAAVVALRVKGYTTHEIADELKCGDRAVRRALFDLRESLPVSDVGIVLDKHAVPEAVDGLMQLLEDRDKDAIFETLKGRGHFRSHQAVKQDGPTTGMTLNVAFVVPEGRGPQASVVHGSVIGTPRDDDAPNPHR